MPTVRDILPQGGFMNKFDLKSGYHHLLIRPSFQKSLGFSWLGCSYVFRGLLFGLSPAPFTFTKLFRPLLAHWRKQGMGIAVYLDHGLIWGNSARECEDNSAIVRRDLRLAGFTVAEEKSSWLPCQKIV
ncbi:hypothetical protein ANCDUO_05222 [Ancylostoma duodenale]|uniref:Reverse transcriptase domain-containing protein n=1 Tax=Ancylostoma duodenale TaxID=51022 RepID=A0A0C2D4Q1_9BILA|nr:hypothetical protein ANCDUO_05222 [Ancylostoma duodenale]